MFYGGDRAGSRYYWAMENTAATESAQFTSGLINPGVRNKVTAFQINPFVKYRGFEVFGVIEQAEGDLVGIPEKAGADRWQIGRGWFILPGLLATTEYVNQEYFGYPPTSKLNGGRFNGLMLDGVVAF
jgi:hypothetical protein